MNVQLHRVLRVRTFRAPGGGPRAGTGRPLRGARGFSLIEVIFMLALLLALIVSGIGAIMLLDRASRHQGHDTTALEVTQGKIEEYMGTPYNPPTAPFTSSTNTSTTNVTISVDRGGTNVTVQGVLTTRIQPAPIGHLITVSLAYTNYRRPLTVQLQTVITKFSGGQP